MALDFQQDRDVLLKLMALAVLEATGEPAGADFIAEKVMSAIDGENAAEIYQYLFHGGDMIDAYSTI